MVAFRGADFTLFWWNEMIFLFYKQFLYTRNSAIIKYNADKQQIKKKLKLVNVRKMKM